jgi:hypothetical protein
VGRGFITSDANDLVFSFGLIVFKSIKEKLALKAYVFFIFVQMFSKSHIWPVSLTLQLDPSQGGCFITVKGSCCKLFEQHEDKLNCI